jgi:hypothetical protein
LLLANKIILYTSCKNGLITTPVTGAVYYDNVYVIASLLH